MLINLDVLKDIVKYHKIWEDTTKWQLFTLVLRKAKAAGYISLFQPIISSLMNSQIPEFARECLNNIQVN